MKHIDGAHHIALSEFEDKYNEVPVVVVSGNLDSGSLQKYKKLGVQHLIDKPFEIEELSETVQKIIDEFLT